MKLRQPIFQFNRDENAKLQTTIQLPTPEGLQTLRRNPILSKVLKFKDQTDKKVLWFHAPRQTGKTTSIIISALLDCLFKPNSKNAIFVDTRMVYHISETIHTFIAINQHIIPIQHGLDKNVIQFANGSTLYIKLATPSNIHSFRGTTINNVYVDSYSDSRKTEEYIDSLLQEFIPAIRGKIIISNQLMHGGCDVECITFKLSAFYDLLNPDIKSKFQDILECIGKTAFESEYIISADTFTD